MKRLNYLAAMALAASMVFVACNQQNDDVSTGSDVSDAVLVALTNAGFDVENQSPIKYREGYLVEGDIYLKESDIAGLEKASRLPDNEQYCTNNLVTTGGSRTITIYASTSSFSTAMIAGLDEAISRYNDEDLEITFQRVTSSSADIVMTRLSTRYERQGVLGSSGFPTSSGDPYDEIQMSGILESTYGLDSDEIASIIAHEMGHCIGFRHTDYYNRAISCGGSSYNEGTAGVGANLIPGTPSTATYSAQSWMLSCTDGSDRPFNTDDVTALTYLY